MRRHRRRMTSTLADRRRAVPVSARNRTLDGMLGALAVAVVAFIAAVFAHLFREGVFWIGEQVFGHANAVEAAKHANPVLVFVSVVVGLTAATAIGKAAARWRGERLGLAAVAAAARNEGAGPSWRATAIRSSGTFA